MEMIRGSFRAAVLMGAAAAVLSCAVGAKAQNRDTDDNRGQHDNPWPYNKLHRSPVLAVVGDVACQPGETEPTGEKKGENCVGDTAQNLFASQAATANQIENMKPDIIALVGDEQYQVGQ